MADVLQGLFGQGGVIREWKCVRQRECERERERERREKEREREREREIVEKSLA